MGTAHGAEELGLCCSHGLACQAGAWGRYVGFCLGYGHIWEIQTSKGRQKYFARPITLAHDKILTSKFYPYNLPYKLKNRPGESTNLQGSPPA
jgi:hypothetical protein